ncbi:KS1 protein-like [Hydra vulgaris]|uniref:KS1 protein-like n=1 Tax=Hydra vulgaris TaxID=6087 RepID=A0ABM4BAG3_HYDVU
MKLYFAGLMVLVCANAMSVTPRPHGIFRIKDMKYKGPMQVKEEANSEVKKNDYKNDKNFYDGIDVEISNFVSNNDNSDQNDNKKNTIVLKGENKLNKERKKKNAKRLVAKKAKKSTKKAIATKKKNLKKLNLKKKEN